MWFQTRIKRLIAVSDVLIWQIMLVGKNDEIVTLSGDCNQRDAFLHESEAVVQPTSAANAEVRLQFCGLLDVL